MSLYTVSITNASGPNSVTIDTSTTPNSINISDGTTLAALTVNTNVSTPLLSDSNPTLSADLNLNGNDITGSGDITTTGDITLTGDMVVSGDLTVNGTTTTLNTQTLDVEDINITVAFGAVDAASANGAGLTVDGADATLIYQSAGDNWALNKPLDVTGNVTVSGTVDGRDVAADGTKLDGIEASADVTDTANVTAAGALMDSEVTNLAQVKAFDSADYATAAQGALADSAVQPNDSPTFGNITVTGTVDGRDVAADGTKLDGIEAGADVTDTANVTAAGALMDSELTDIAAVKALDQGVATTDSPTFAGLTVDTDTLYVDATNDRVGVGTTSPTNPLHIVSNAAAPLFVERTGSSNTSIKLENDDNTLYVGMTAGGSFAVDDDSNLQSGPWFKVESDGTAKATAFEGDGSALTNLPVSVAVYVDDTGGASADSTSDTVVPATTAEIEDTSNYSNTSGVVTVTDAGTYCVKGNVGITSTTSNYRWTGELSIVKNGSTVVGKVRGAYLRGNGGSNDSYIHIDKMLSLAASDTIQLKVKRINNTTGNATFLADVSTLQLQKL